MLNFTSSGGLFRPELQNGFFGSLHAFWNGAGFVEGIRGHLYFGGHGVAQHVWTLGAWLLVGLAVTGIAAVWERRGRGAAQAALPQAVPSSEDRRESAEEEMEESVAV